MTFGNTSPLPFVACESTELNAFITDDRYFNKNDEENENKSRQPSNIRMKSNKNEDGMNLSTFSNCQYYSVDDFSSLEFNDSLNIFHCNINGLESKIDQVHEFLSNSKSSIDIIAFTETSLKSSAEFFNRNVKLDGYVDISTPSNTRKGGTTLFISSKYNSIERHDFKVINDHFESVWMEIKNEKGKNVVCGSIYRHPHDNAEQFESFLNYLEKTLLKLSKENKEIFICGDFNCDLLKIEHNKNYDIFYELMACYGLFPTISIPTRTQGFNSTIIDNIFTSNIENSSISGVVTTDFSDHFAQFISLQKLKIDWKALNIYARDYSHFSTESFRDDVSIQNFDTNLEDVNQQFHDFYFKLAGCIERHAPIKKLKPSEIRTKQKPWITSELQRMIRLKNKFFHRKKRQPNNENANRIYNIFRNRVNRERKRAKENYYTNYFNENSKSSKKVWDGIKSIINTKSDKLTKINELKLNNRIIDNPREIAETFNNFFYKYRPKNRRKYST